MRTSYRKSFISSLLALAVIGAGSSVLASPARAAVAHRTFDCGDNCPVLLEYSGAYGWCETNASGGTNTYCEYFW